MMDYSLLDSKLKHLIQVCKETKNYKKIAVTGFILISNLLDEIGIKLGIRPHNKLKEEKIFEYMRIINDVFETNLQVKIFSVELLDTIKKCELLFLRSRGDVPFEYLKEILNAYYELRKLEVPNLHEQLKEGNIIETPNLFSFLSPRTKKDSKDPNKLKPLILHKIKQKEISLRETLNYKFNPQLLETAIYLKKVRKGIEENDHRKIVYQGSLKNNINYQQSLEQILGYFTLGAFLFAFLFGFAITIETMLYPLTINTQGIYLLILFGTAALLFIVYWHYFRTV